MDLGPYRRKRRFAATPEPPGRESTPGGRPRFVVQEHHASHVHWDLRLEMEGVLRSWAVPKGPSLDPAEKRLAVLVEDHPIDYADFEGIIPKGNYGAGTVMVWDRGAYESRSMDPEAAFKKGHLTLQFFGEKLRGQFHLVRTKRNGGKQWLFFKSPDEFAASGYRPTGTRSVKSGRSIDEIRTDQDSRWASADASAPAAEPADPFPVPFRPMLAQLAPRPFDDPDWFFEVKWDGVRTLAFARRRGAAQDVMLYSRTLRPLNRQFPEIVQAVSGLEVDSIILDGEIVAPDEHGQSSFALLQERLHVEREADVRDRAGRIQVAYAVFDCLYLGGHDLRGRPFEERRKLLESVPLRPGIFLTEGFAGTGRALFDAAREHGLEGIIAKKRTSAYRPGVRSPEWQKFKVRRTLEAVIGGMTRGKGHRRGTFGALILGQYDPATGALVHIGQTGGGLTDADLRQLRRKLEPLVTDACPFRPRPNIPQRAAWVRPKIVVEVEYGERTRDGMLRFPLFLRVRDDVAPHEAVLQTDQGAPVPRDALGSARRQTRPARDAEAAVRTASRSPSIGGAPPELHFTNLDKIFYPERGVTKGDVVKYYQRIASTLLPHLEDRPLTLRRFPNGIHGEDFFQKAVPDAPAYVRTERIAVEDGGKNVRMVVCNDEATLLWLTQMGCIEMHPWYSRLTPAGARRSRRRAAPPALDMAMLDYPDFIVFDIDPFLFPKGKRPEKRHGEYDPDYTRQGFEAARQAALWLGEILHGLGLRAFAKTSGKTGLHVFVPIVREYTYQKTHAFAKTLATWLVQQHPDELTIAWAVPERVGRVFVDYNQNIRGKTLASVYSLRPVPDATVSVPITWEELRAGFDPLEWTHVTIFDRLARVGDLWAGILKAAQKLNLRRPRI